MNCPRCRRKAVFQFKSEDLEYYNVYECPHCQADFYVEIWDIDKEEKED